MIFRYNILILITRLFFLCVLLFSYLSIIYLILTDSRIVDNYSQAVFIIFIFFILIGFRVFSLIRSIIAETYNISLSQNEIRLIRPIRKKEKIFEKGEIKGYSKSNINYGNLNAVKWFRTDSIVIYYQNSKPFEIIKFNYRSFNKIESFLKENNIPFLGTEKYQTGFFFRKYKY